MDANNASMCAVLAALRCPPRIPDLLKLFPELPDREPTYTEFWSALKNCVAAGIPSVPQDLYQRILFDVNLHAPAYLPAITALIEHVRGRTDLDPSYLMELLKQYAMKEEMELARTAEGKWIQHHLQRATEISAMGVSAVLDPVDFFADGMLTGHVIVPTGCEFVDAPFGGLFPAGAMLLMVMPTKGGKTTAAIQYAKTLVEAGMPVLNMNYEQDAKGNLTVRHLAAMSNTSMKVWLGKRSVRDPQIPQDARDALMTAKPKWDQHYRFFGARELNGPNAMTKGAESIHQLVTDQYISRGLPPPELIIVDWWRCLWMQYQSALLAKGQYVDSARMRSLEAEQFRSLKMLAESLGSRVLVFMQMAAALSQKSFNIDRISTADAAENKALVQLADVGIVSTTKDPQTGLVTFKTDASRFDNNDWRGTFRLDGEHCCFSPANMFDVNSLPDEDYQEDEDFDAGESGTV